MKSRKYILLSLIVLLSMPLFNECRRGENDPWLSFRSRDSRISAVWTLESGYSDSFLQLDEQFNWEDQDCEDATLVDNYNFSDSYTYTFNYSTSLVHYVQAFTTNRQIVDVGGAMLEGNEWEDANSIIRDINYSYEITIKTNGTYRVYITYNVIEEDFPQEITNDQGETQFGKTFSGTYEYIDNWRWMDDGLGTKSCIRFEGFPQLVVEITPKLDLSLAFEYNYISAIDFSNEAMTFTIDKLEHKSLTLKATTNENGYYQEQDEPFEAYMPNGDNIECQGLYTFNKVNNGNFTLQFTSDGKNVDQ